MARMLGAAADTEKGGRVGNVLPWSPVCLVGALSWIRCLVQKPMREPLGIFNKTRNEK